MKGYSNYVIIILVLLLFYFAFAYFSTANEPRITIPQSKHSLVVDSLNNVIDSLINSRDSLMVVADSLRDENVAIESRIIERNKERNEIYNQIMDSPADSSYKSIQDYLRSDTISFR